MGNISSLYSEEKEGVGQPINNGYERVFSKGMYKNNEKLLNHLADTLIAKKEDNLSILDLSGKGGELAASLLRRNIDANYTLVERTKEQLSIAKARLGEDIRYKQGEAGEFLKECLDESYDIIICTDAFKDITFKSLIKESKRIIKPNGKLVILIGLRNSMSELKKIHYKLLLKNRKKITSFVSRMSYPSSRKEIEKFCSKNGLTKIICQEARQVFGFASGKRLVRWILSTGILLDYEEKLDLQDKQMQESFIKLIEEEQLEWITHKFVYGIWEKN